MRDNTRRYSIEIRDVVTEKSVLVVGADWTEYEKGKAIAQIKRLAELSDATSLKTAADAERR